MVENNFYSRGQNLIRIIIVLVVIGSIAGGLYYCFQKEETVSQKIPPGEKVEEKPAEVPESEILLLLVEEALYQGLNQELDTYSNDVRREFGFETILKTFSSSANVFEIKFYIKQIYNNYKLNGVLLIGDLPTGKFYHPTAPIGLGGLVESDFVYQDIYDACPYSVEKATFSYENPGCKGLVIQPYWIARLTPNSSSKKSLSLLKDYFRRNHDYRTGGYVYKRKFLSYQPILLDEDLELREKTISKIQNSFLFLDTYKTGNYNFIDINNDNSDSIYFEEIKTPFEYEVLFYNGHGAPTLHQKNIRSESISNISFLFAEFRSCSVGRFTTKDYIAGEYLFDNGLLMTAASVPVLGTSLPNMKFYYLLSLGLPFYEALNIRGIGMGINILGDPTLKMRYVEKPSDYALNDPVISFSYTRFDIVKSQESIRAKIKNTGNSPLRFRAVVNYHKQKNAQFSGNFVGVSTVSPKFENGANVLGSGEEGSISLGDLICSDPQKIGTYNGELFIISNDPVRPFFRIPFEVRE